MPGRTAAIIGGSLSGLIAARLLSRRGWNVHLFERVQDDLAGRGAGIGTHPELFDVLREAEIPCPPDLGMLVQTRRLLGHDGCILLEHHYPQVLTHWDRLYALLKGYTPDDRYHRGKSLKGITRGERRVTALFDDGSSFEADLLVAADGIRSTVRSVVCPDIRPHYAGYIAWRCVIPEEILPARARSECFDHFCFCLPAGEQIAGYPVRRAGTGPMPAGREYNIIWYRPADEDALADLLTDESGHRHAMNIPPPLINPKHIGRAKEDAAAILAPQFADAIALADNLFCQPIYDVEATKMATGQIAMLGDAAFVARPHVGAGVTKAFSDALALARALDREASIADSLKAFEAERLPIGRQILERARHLGAYMQASRNTEAERIFADTFRRPEAVLRETASLDFMQHPVHGQVVRHPT